MTPIDTASEIDWAKCELIEQVPGKVSGRPIARGTRILPDAIVNSYDAGDSIELIRRTIRGFHSANPTTLESYVRRGPSVLKNGRG